MAAKCFSCSQNLYFFLYIVDTFNRMMVNTLVLQFIAHEFNPY